MKRRALWVVGLGAGHAVLTMSLLLVTVGAVVAAFDGKRPSSVWDAVGLWTVQILTAPLAPIYRQLVPHDWSVSVPVLSRVVFLANSLIWGMAITWLIHYRRPTV